MLGGMQGLVDVHNRSISQAASERVVLLAGYVTMHLAE